MIRLGPVAAATTINAGVRLNGGSTFITSTLESSPLSLTDDTIFPGSVIVALGSGSILDLALQSTGAATVSLAAGTNASLSVKLLDRIRQWTGSAALCFLFPQNRSLASSLPASARYLLTVLSGLDAEIEHAVPVYPSWLTTAAINGVNRRNPGILSTNPSWQKPLLRALRSRGLLCPARDSSKRRRHLRSPRLPIVEIPQIDLVAVKPVQRSRTRDRILPHVKPGDIQ